MSVEEIIELEHKGNKIAEFALEQYTFPEWIRFAGFTSGLEFVMYRLFL